MGSHEACSPSPYQQRAWVKMPYYFRLQDSVLPPYAHTAFTTVLLGTEGALHLQPHQQGHSEGCGSWLRHLPQGTCSSMNGCAQLVIIKTGTSVKPPLAKETSKAGRLDGRGSHGPAPKSLPEPQPCTKIIFKSHLRDVYVQLLSLGLLPHSRLAPCG